MRSITDYQVSTNFTRTLYRSLHQSSRGSPQACTLFTKNQNQFNIGIIHRFYKDNNFSMRLIIILARLIIIFTYTGKKTSNEKRSSLNTPRLILWNKVFPFASRTNLHACRLAVPSVAISWWNHTPDL